MIRMGDTIALSANGGIIQVVVLYSGDDLAREIKRQTNGVKFRVQGSHVRLLNAEIVGSTYAGATPGADSIVALS